MKIRLQGGPLHNKAYDVADDRDFVVNVANGKDLPFYMTSDQISPTFQIPYKTVLYRPVTMRDVKGRVAYAMNPKGETFFKHVS